MMSSNSRETLHFRDFALDVAGYQLRHNGRPVRLERQPMDLLILLVERRLQLVSRSEIVERLWGKDVFVDVETGVHTAIRKIRQALHDSPEAPVFVETVSGKGYRFIAPVEVVPASPDPPAAQAPESAVAVPSSSVPIVTAAPVVDIEPARPANATGPVRLAWDGGTTTLRDGDHIVGRDPEASIVLNVDSVSRRHAIITVAGSYATVADLGSKNGTSIGSTRIDTLTRLVDGDQIHIGSVPAHGPDRRPARFDKDRDASFDYWSGLVSAGSMPRDESSQFRDATRTLEPGVDETTMRRRPPVLSPGETFGRFRLIQLLGRGGMGEAYEAEDLKSGERVALKMSRDVLATEQQREQFLREGRVVAAISHPHLVYVVGTEEIQEIPVLVTELVTGSTLRARVTEGGPLPSIEAVDMILQVISGLAALAAHGVLHRDVKPSNCFVGPDGRVKVGDFGLAISTRPDATVTRTGDVVGTRAFASPEQLRAAPPDIRSDIYSVGATLHYLLTARDPHSEGEAPAVAVPSRDTRGQTPGVPRKLGKIVRQCLAQSPARRPQSYARLSTLLVPFSSAAQVSATPGPRVLAFVVDMAVLRVGSALPLLAVIQWNVPVTLFGIAAAHVILILCYFVLSETIWSASPGKIVLGLRVIRADRRPLGAGRVCIRAAVWCAATVPGFVALLMFGPSGLGTVASGAGAVGYFTAVAGTLHRPRPVVRNGAAAQRVCRPA